MVHPAYLESGGIVLMEAIVAGLPVLATGTCGFAPHIARAEAGYVLPEPFQQADLDAKLTEVLFDDAQLATWEWQLCLSAFLAINPSSIWIMRRTPMRKLT